MRILSLAFILFVPFVVRSAEPVDPERFEKEVVVSGLEDGAEMDVLADGRVLVVERAGGVKMYLPAAKKTVKLGSVQTATFGEVGVLGVAAALDFDKSGFLYILYCPRENTKIIRISRFTVFFGDKFSPESERKLIEIPIDGPDAAIHMGGGLAVDSKGNLYIGIGDNSPPIPELPVDQRPGHEHHDALRSAANSMDLRGKILRIHPENGSYTVPKDNLFADGKDGKPEIFVMGTRNPYRIVVDHKTDWVYWADVGPNVIEEIKVGPNGYDELNRAKAAGNFGWPMFVGPNEPYSEFDFVTRKPGRKFDVNRPENRSKNNTGLKILPPPQPAFLWYPTFESKEWPVLGSGGRSIMAGPVYYHDSHTKSATRLPDQFDRTLFICEWMRNWIMAVHLDAAGNIKSVEPFAKNMLFRRPIDLRIGPDGALYVLEYGDKWSGNADGQVTRIVYRRGNRPPVAIIEADKTAGKAPLTVRFSDNSYSKENGKTSHTWRLVNLKDPNDKIVSQEVELKVMFKLPGTYEVFLDVIDTQRASSTASIKIHVGNAPPMVRFLEPLHGGFFDWGQPVGYRVEAEDEEDGSTVKGTIPAERVVVRSDYQVRRRSLGDEGLHPGLAMMRKTTCFSCHTAEGQSKGPPYHAVAKKYAGQKDAREMLAKKVIGGGTGVWGSYPMPPHPQHTIEQTRVMVDWVLSLTAGPALPPSGGTEGGFVPTLDANSFPTGFPDSGVQVLTATYSDNGAAGAPPLTGEAIAVLHARKKKAAYHDFSRGVQVVDDLEDEHGMIAWFGPGDYLGFAEMNLSGIDRLTCRVRGRAGAEGTFEIRLDSPTGPLLGKAAVPGGKGEEVSVPIQAPAGVHDLYFVAAEDRRGKPGGSPDRKTISLNWIEFHDSPEAAAARKQARQLAAKRITARAAAAKNRPFVRNWVLDDLKAELSEVGKNRSLDRGRKLYEELACSRCHKIGQTGGTVGPDLTDVASRMATQPAPREALLTEILEPSKVIDKKYRTSVVHLDNGQTLAGIIVAQDAKTVRIAADPAQPDAVRDIPRARIEEMKESDVSLMPVGLLNTLAKDEIWDLLAFLEAKK